MLRLNTFGGLVLQQDGQLYTGPAARAGTSCWRCSGPTPSGGRSPLALPGTPRHQALGRQRRGLPGKQHPPAQSGSHHQRRRRVRGGDRARGARGRRWEESLGRFAEALRYDPRSGVRNFDVGDNYFSLRMYSEADHYLERAMTLSPAKLLGPLALAYSHLGRHAEAVRAGERAAANLPVERDAVSGPFVLGYLARVYLMANRPEQAIAILERLSRLPTWVSPAELRVDPIWDPLRNNPRFQRLVEGVAPVS